MKKKKNKKFKDLDINIENKPFNLLEKSKTIKDTLGNNIITNDTISYFILKQRKNINKNSYFFSIYTKENLELIQEINQNLYHQCLPIDENSIFFTKIIDSKTDLWTKDTSNKFIKNKSLEIKFNSNILYNSKSQLLFHNLSNNKDNSEIQVWETKDNLPKNIIFKFPTVISYKKKLFFLNNEKILLVYHYPIIEEPYNQHSNDISISFYNTDNYENIKHIVLDNKYCDLKPYKLDENRIINVEKISDDCSYDDNIEEKINIMKVPEFKIVKEIKIYYECKDILVYKNYFMICDSTIRIFNSENYELFKEVDIPGVFRMIFLKENYLVGLCNQYMEMKKKFEIDENENKPIRDLILYKANF